MEEKSNWNFSSILSFLFFGGLATFLLDSFASTHIWESIGNMLKGALGGSDNPLTRLSDDELKKVYTSKLNEWEKYVDELNKPGVIDAMNLEQIKNVSKVSKEHALTINSLIDELTKRKIINEEMIDRATGLLRKDSALNTLLGARSDAISAEIERKFELANKCLIARETLSAHDLAECDALAQQTKSSYILSPKNGQDYINNILIAVERTNEAAPEKNAKLEAEIVWAVNTFHKEILEATADNHIETNEITASAFQLYVLLKRNEDVKKLLGDPNNAELRDKIAKYAKHIVDSKGMVDFGEYTVRPELKEVLDAVKTRCGDDIKCTAIDVDHIDLPRLQRFIFNPISTPTPGN